MSAVWTILLLLGCFCHVIAQNVTDITETNDVNVTTTSVTSAGPTLSPELQELMNYAVDLVEHNFTSTPVCKDTVTKIIRAQTSVDGSCNILCMAKGLLWAFQECNEQDYDLLKNGLCGNYTCPTSAPVIKTTSSPEERKRHRENIMCVIDNQLSTEECMHTAQSQAEGEDDPDRACNTLKSFETALATLHCSAEDYNKLYAVICDQQIVPCSPVASLIKKLTPRCTSTMNAATAELNGPNACNYIESSRQQLIRNQVCTLGDYEKLQQLLCVPGSSLTKAVTEGERLDAVEKLITWNLTNSCRDVVWPEFQIYSLDQLCVKVNSTGMTLVREKVCSREDFDLLKATVCVVHREYSPEEQKLRENIHKLIVTLTTRCKNTMLDQERQMQETTVQEACTKLTASHEALRSTDTCSEVEITQLSKLLCNRACTLSFNWVAVLVCYLLLTKINISV